MMENYKQNYIHKPYLFLAILFSLLSCQKEVVSKVTFERKLSGIKPETEFRLDSLRMINGKNAILFHRINSTILH